MTRISRFLITISACLALAWIAAPASHAVVCVVPDNGSGTADMPPAAGQPSAPDCTQGYVSPSAFHEIIDGFPPGTTIEIGPEHTRFITISQTPGGSLGGQTETFDSSLELQLQGTGDLAGYNRTLTLQLDCTTETGPRNPTDDVQTFPNEMVQLQGSLFGDPDFDVLHFRAGTGQGLPPSPGQTTLTRLPSGDFNVDSFFDITYEIEFVGAPGSQLAGFAGTTQGTVEMRIGEAVQATPASGRLGVLFAALALALLIPVALYLRRTTTA